MHHADIDPKVVSFTIRIRTQICRRLNNDTCVHQYLGSCGVFFAGLQHLVELYLILFYNYRYARAYYLTHVEHFDILATVTKPKNDIVSNLARMQPSDATQQPRITLNRFSKLVHI